VKSPADAFIIALRQYFNLNLQLMGGSMNGRTVRVLSALLVLCGFSGVAKAQGREACDRACLTGFVTQYLDAMIAHKPEALPVAPNLKFTENRVEMKLGEGLWKNVSRLIDYRMDIIDVREGVAISHSLVEENGSPVMFALRLKIRDRKIAEVETMAVRGQKEGMIFKPEALKKVSPAMTLQPERSQLNSREEMIKIAVLYPAGLKTGSFVKVDAPFKTDAYRFENGQLMAGPGCTFFQGCDNIKTQRIPTLAGITHHVAAVDEELGIVLLRMDFGPGATFQGNNSLDVWEAFKIYGGQIHAVEAYMRVVPVGTKTGWE
jgi:hypothetical protein